MRLSDAQRMRDADDAAIHVTGIPSDLLMTNAAGHVARAALELMRTKSAVVFCGSGNNGGDGVAAALYLTRWGVQCRVLLAGSRAKMTQDTQEMARRYLSLGGRVEDFDPEEPGLAEALKNAGVIIDALFGAGLSRALSGKALRAVEMMNASGAPVVSADIASGVEADTGQILGAAVMATRTVTFTRAKPGHFVEPGCVCCGELEVADIGIPREYAEKSEIPVWAVEKDEVLLPRRPRLSRKTDYGRLLILGGSVGYTGAVSLCAGAACRAGAGLVSAGVPEAIYRITAVKNDEAMPFPLADDAQGRLSAAALPAIAEKLRGADVCVLGPGLGRSEALTGLVSVLAAAEGGPMVVDADGLFALSRNMEAVKDAPRPLVLTPHEGEYARMGGRLDGGRLAGARDFAQSHGCTLVLKGHRTLCAFPDGEVYIIPHGNPGMARGGSGDVLAGVLGAMLCQFPLKRAVVTGCWLHARAGDLCAGKYGEYAMLPSDIINALPEAFGEITTGCK